MHTVQSLPNNFILSYSISLHAALHLSLSERVALSLLRRVHPRLPFRLGLRSLCAPAPSSVSQWRAALRAGRQRGSAGGGGSSGTSSSINSLSHTGPSPTLLLHVMDAIVILVVTHFKYRCRVHSFFNHGGAPLLQETVVHGGPSAGWPSVHLYNSTRQHNDNNCCYCMCETHFTIWPTDKTHHTLTPSHSFYLLYEADFSQLQTAVDQTLLLRLPLTEPPAVGLVPLTSLLLIRHPASPVQTLLLPERSSTDR